MLADERNACKSSLMIINYSCKKRDDNVRSDIIYGDDDEADGG